MPFNSSVTDVQVHDTALLEGLARKYNLSYQAFGKDVAVGEGAKYGSLVLSDAWGTALEPAPVSPNGKHDLPYQLLSGTIKATYNSHRNFRNDKQVQVAPGIMTGNTGLPFFFNSCSCVVLTGSRKTHGITGI